MYPLFLTDKHDELEMIESMHQPRMGLGRLEAFLKPLVAKGLHSVMLFGVPLIAKKVDMRFS